MNIPDQLLEVGRIGKAHGLRGEVVVAFSSDRDERHEPGSRLQTEKGEDLVVKSSRPHQNRWLVFFDGITGRESIEERRGQALFAERIEDDGVLWVHDLVDCIVIDGGVERGTVVALQDNPASDLLVLDNGTLVPLNFLVDGPTDGKLYTETPVGLFDLNDSTDDEPTGND